MQNFHKSILIILILGLVIMFVKGYFYQEEIRDNKKQTVCKFVLCKSFPKTTESYFKYKINNKWYRNSYGNCPDDYDQKINKFFTLYYSSKDPNKIEVDFTEQVLDSTSILQAGFKKEELNNIYNK